MAIKKVYELAVDLKRTSVRVNIPVLVQGDSAEFRIRLLDNGADLSTEQLTGITSVKMQSGYDAQTVIQTVGALQGSVAVFRLKKNELFRSGTVQAMVQLEDTEDRISTLRFQYQVIPDLAGNYIPGEQDITVFQRYMNDAQAKIDEMAATDVAQLTVKLAETAEEIKRKRELEDLSPNVIAAIEGGEGTSFNLLSIPQDSSVTPKKTTFINISTNMLDASAMIPGNLSSGDGAYIESTSYRVSDFIPVDSDSQYSVKNIYKIVRYNASKTYLNQYFPGVDGDTFPTTATTKYIRIVSFNASYTTSQLNRGGTVLPFEKFYERMKESFLPPKIYDGVDIIDKTIPLNKMEFVHVSSNLYNFETTTAGKIVNSSGVLQDSTQNSLSDFIPIEPSVQYTLANAHTTVFYTADKVFISRPSNTGTFTAPASAGFVRLVMNNSQVQSVQLNKGSVLLPFEKYGTYIPRSVLPQNLYSDGGNAEQKTYYFSPENIVGFYHAPEKTYEKPETSNDYYALFNQLATDHPNYITSTLKGNDATGTYPIFQYRLSPQNVEASELNKTIPKILIVCGLHGEEKSSVYSVYHMVERLCNGWKDDPLLEYLRWNVEIVMIPLVNPYGFNHSTILTRYGRKNGNGVDLNRNFSEGWTLGSPDSADYGGTAPFSELEAQYVKIMIDNNSDAIHFGDYHTNGSSGEVYNTLMWMSQTNGDLYNENVDISTRYIIGKATREFIKKYNLPENEGNFGYTSYSNLGGTAKVYGAKNVISSATFECFKKFPTETSLRTDTNIRACTEFFANWLLTLVKQFKTSYHSNS